MTVFVAGLIGIIFFYIAILVVGIWASRKAKNNSEEEMMLAGRSLGFVVGSLTLIATWVGGGYISGASEVMFLRGLAWAQVPIGYSVALLMGALLFVKPMRKMKCVTLLDPFQRMYGNRVGCILFIPTIFGDIFWVASILNALGSALVVITGLSPLLSILVSSVFVAAYTSVGAMYSVTYTDVFQMFFLLFGLLISIPFVATSDYVKVDALKNVDWRGEIKPSEGSEWFDTMMLLIFGGIPWQGYMQRILSIRSTKIAQYLSIFSTFGCAVMSIPSAYIGIVARAIDWKDIPSYKKNITEAEASVILPLVLRHLTPPVIAFFGLGAISAAVMSSADSSVLAFSVMVSRNIYKNLLRQSASDKEIIWVLRITVLIITVVSAVIALTVSSVYYLSVLSSDLIYVVLFPQLLLVIYWASHANSYGCIASFLVGALLRILGGEHALGLPAVIKYPMYDYEKGMQKFPHRTTAMLCALITHMLVSEITNILFKRNILPRRYDVLRFFHRDDAVRISICGGRRGSQQDVSDERELPDAKNGEAKRKDDSETTTTTTTTAERDAEKLGAGSGRKRKWSRWSLAKSRTPSSVGSPDLAPTPNPEPETTPQPPADEKPRMAAATATPETMLGAGDSSVESYLCINEEILNLNKINDFTVNHRLRSFNREKS